jgi:hypothetical protein
MIREIMNRGKKGLFPRNLGLFWVLMLRRLIIDIIEQEAFLRADTRERRLGLTINSLTHWCIFIKILKNMVT